MKRKHFKLPSLKQWIKINQFLTKQEKIAFFTFLVLFIGSLSYLSCSFYIKHTIVIPSTGGIFKEGVVGQPQHINPVYDQINDTDRDLTNLVYSGLMKYNTKGQIVPDMAKECKRLSGGKIFECYLKDNVFFHDGKRVTANDVIFTVKTIQNSDFKSPLRANWLGVTVEKISDQEVRFKLKEPYAPFLERLTLKILPEHIWKNEKNFNLSPYNLEPIGSGPYQFKKLIKNKSGEITSIQLKRFAKYYGNKPHISQIRFIFFNKEENLIAALKRRKIDGCLPSLDITKYNIPRELGINIFSFPSPRYFGVFFNPLKNNFLADKKIRQALIYGTDREKIIKTIFPIKNGVSSGRIVNSPILPKIYHYSQPSKIYNFNPSEAEKLFKEAGLAKKSGKLVKIIPAKKMIFMSDLRYGSRGREVNNLQKCLSSIGGGIYPKGQITGYYGKNTKDAVIRFQEKYAKEILSPYGLKKGTGEVRGKTREKLNEICIISPEKIIPIKITLTTVKDDLLIRTAEILKDQWEKLGVGVRIKTFPIDVVRDNIIKKRDYEALLFGEALGIIPDPFPFWHSSQRVDPGLNLADYSNKSADKLLEKGRTEISPSIRAQEYEKFQDILIESAPCEFLYNSNYIYLISNKIKGIKKGIIISPSGRFNDIEDWYIKTRRAWK